MKGLAKRVGALETRWRPWVDDLDKLSDGELDARIVAAISNHVRSGALDLPSDWPVRFATDPDSLLASVVSQLRF